MSSSNSTCNSLSPKHMKSYPSVDEARNSSSCVLDVRFANLPEATKARFESPGSNYSVGWSHGKEILEAGLPDFAKGSFYANPCHDPPFEDDPAGEEHRAWVPPNIWPDDVADGVSDFSKEFKALGQAIVRVGVLLARQCDK